VLDEAERFRGAGGALGALARRRGEQRAAWMWRKAEETVVRLLRAEPAVQARARALEAPPARLSCPLLPRRRRRCGGERSGR